jgi:biotin carboxyl carrier protein
MTMETNINADRDGKIDQVLVKPGTGVESGELLLILRVAARTFP